MISSSSARISTLLMEFSGVSPRKLQMSSMVAMFGVSIFSIARRVVLILAGHRLRFGDLDVGSKSQLSQYAIVASPFSASTMNSCV